MHYANMRGSIWIVFNLMPWLNTAPLNRFIRETMFTFTKIHRINLGLLSQELLSVRQLSVFLFLSMLTLMIPGWKDTVVVNDGFMKTGSPTLGSNIRKQGTEYWSGCLTGWISQSKCDAKCSRHFFQLSTAKRLVLRKIPNAPLKTIFLFCWQTQLSCAVQGENESPKNNNCESSNIYRKLGWAFCCFPVSYLVQRPRRQSWNHDKE